MKILFIGEDQKISYSYYQFKILKKIYKDVEIINLKKINNICFLLNKLSWHLNFKFYDLIILFFLNKKTNQMYDLIYVNNETLIGKKSICYLKKISKKIIYYCTDNPFKNGDNKRWDLVKNHFDLFDIVIFMQKNRLIDSTSYGIKNKIWIPPTIKINEFKKLSRKKIKKKYDIIIVSTYRSERELLVGKLLNNKFNIKVHGDHWERSGIYKKNRSIFFSKIVNDNKYVETLRSGKISICLPSFENNDDITHRSLEIPLVGTMLLAKKTKTHEEFFKNNFEAVFFNNLNDCIKKCHQLLKNEIKIKKITKQGSKKISSISNMISFETNIKKIISNLFLN